MTSMEHKGAQGFGPQSPAGDAGSRMAEAVRRTGPPRRRLWSVALSAAAAVAALSWCVGDGAAGDPSLAGAAANRFELGYGRCYRVHYAEPAYAVLNCHEVGQQWPLKELVMAPSTGPARADTLTQHPETGRTAEA